MSDANAIAPKQMLLLLAMDIMKEYRGQGVNINDAIGYVDKAMVEHGSLENALEKLKQIYRDKHKVN